MFKALSPYSSSASLTVNQEHFLKAGPLTIGLINLIGGLLLGLVCIIGTFVRLDGNENVDKGVLLRQGILFIICAVIGRLFFFSSFNLSSFNSSFFFTPQLFSGLLGVLGACLEKPGLVFVFAVLFVIFDIVAIFIFGIVGGVSQPFMLPPLAFTVTIKSFFFRFVLSILNLLQVSINIYFAVCLFSYYYELKNKKKVEGRDVELATAGKNNSYPVYTVKPV